MAETSEDDQDTGQNIDVESGIKSERVIDMNKIFYDLKELKPFGDKLWYSYREYIRYGYRAHPQMTYKMCAKTVV